MLELDLAFRRGRFELELNARLEHRVSAIFGPSGCGKTTLLNLVAGLESPSAGRIALNGETLFDSRAEVNLPPERRRVSYIFQEGRLFPHLSVTGNLRYGLRRGDGGGPAFDEVVEVLGLEPLLRRRPDRLSGGEKQRVALGRCLLRSPKLLLLDEPLAALDDQLKARILPFLARTVDHFDIPVLYVSHSASELRSLVEHVYLMADGRLRAEGSVDEILPREAGN